MPRPDVLRFTAQQPTYRFHGHNPPKRIVNELPSGPVTGGVATLRLYDPIDSWGGEWGVSAKEFTAALDQLPNDVHTIQLHVNSPGGEVFDGIAILNALRNHPAKVVAVVDGIAASAASFIAAGADELVMSKNSELMIHDARGLAIGNASDMTDMARLLNHLSDNVASVYANKTGGTVADWRQSMLAESWFSAEEAVTAGLADRIEGDAQPTNHIDRSNFRYQGRAHAPVPTLTLSVQDARRLAGVGTAKDEQLVNLDPHEYYDPDGDGLCEICGTPEAVHDQVSAPMSDTMRFRHRLNARKYQLPV